MEKQIKFKLLGMDTDSDVSIMNGTSSIQNYNVRFTVTDEGGADAAISNERGTAQIQSIHIDGIPIGYCTVYNFLIIFATNKSGSFNGDKIYIYKHLQDEDTFQSYYTYAGDLGFDVKCPIDCQSVWEREDLLKVFWVDGKNPLRFLTIPSAPSSTIQIAPTNYFDTVKKIDFSEDLELSIDVTKQSFGGTFPAGTIQYAFTYYTKYGSESNIFKVTPLFYISNGESGAPSDRSLSCSFQIQIKGINQDSNWDYLRVYSILRTAINGTPVCKKVIDISINDLSQNETITYVDNGEFGETLDSTRLLYVGGERIIPKTISQKDGTLFLGNYKIIRPEINSSVRDALKTALSKFQNNFFNTYYTKNNQKYSRKIVSVLDTADALNSAYQYTSQLLDSQNKITTFKSGETYRIGVQFQDTSGRWSDPVFLFDTVNNAAPDTVSSIPTQQEPLSSQAESSQSRSSDLNIEDQGYVKFKPIDTLVDGGGGGGSGGSSGNNNIGTKTVNSAVKALLAFGYINLKLGNIQYSQGTLLDYLRQSEYVRVRPVIVYPSEGSREVLFQGVANPTIRKGPEPTILDYRMPSWFFRPIESTNSSTTGTGSSTHYGYGNKYNVGQSFRGVYPVYENGVKIPYYDYTQLYNNSQAEFQYKTTDGFWVDWSVLTIDSPDIRFNEQIGLNDLEGVKVRVVGLVDLAGNSASYSIETEGGIEPVESLETSKLMDTVPMGNKLQVPFQYLSGNIKSFNYGACLINYPFWIDGFSDRGEQGYDKCFAQWYVFPWHRNGSLNNCASTNMNNVESSPKPSVLKRKILANSRFSYTTVYGSSDTNFNIKHARVFMQNSENQIDRFPDGSLFKNSVDVVLPASGLPAFRAIGIINGSDETNLNFRYAPGQEYSKTSFTIKQDNSDIKADNTNILSQFFGVGTASPNAEMRYYDPHHDSIGNDNQYHVGNDPIPMQFKTGSNCVIQLPSTLNYNSLIFTTSQGTQSFKSAAQGHWLPLVEVYREVQNKFGGNSEDALKQNAWLVAGKPVNLSEDIDLFWDYGDTYFQRYDCLKTMPYRDSSINNIIEILSFFCETRINIDGRYDVNRGLQDSTTITVNNFNQLNDVYTQQDNYFQYYISDEDLSKLNSYQNQVIWSLTKKSGDIIDPWTNVTLLNYLDLDGERGQIRAIKNFNGQLYVFQDTGISSINYNQNVLLNAQEGIPIEIANSGKVSGSTYISTSQGCVNKWAIADIGQGILFLDQLNKQFNLFDGKQIVNLGERSKFQSWIRKNCSSADQWNPVWEDIDPNTVTFLYDKDANEILFVSKNFSVAYNLGLMKFTSFYSYEGCPWITKLDSRQFIFNTDSSGIWKAWDIRKGRPNEFFNTFKPYYIEFVASDSKYFDYMKMFSTIEIRDNITASIEDTYERSYNKYSLQNMFSFDHIRAFNSYQDSGTQKLDFKKYTPSNMKAKFRTWRINVPRNANKGVGRIKDRIRDHYMTVRLSHLDESYQPVKVHDIIASYMI